MKEYNILNGDSLSIQLEGFKSEKIVIRECLVEGNVKGETLEELFKNRANFFKENYEITEEEYVLKSKNEISKITTIENNSLVNLWFENDLFCQVNFWFTVNTIYNSGKNNILNIVSPLKSSWDGFGCLTYEELLGSYDNRKELKQSEQKWITELWKAYQESNWKVLKANSKKLNKVIDKIEEVVEAHIERFPGNKKYGRPEESILKIKKELKEPSFSNVFKKFSKVEGIYGFGDLQVKRIIDEMENK